MNLNAGRNRAILGAVVAIAAVAALRRLGPRLEERAMAKCHEMMSARASTPCAEATSCA